MWFDYDISALAKLISPLYEDIGDYELIIYAKRIKELVLEIDIDYLTPVYQSTTDGFAITESIFDELCDNIYVEKVFQYDINGKQYSSYSQAVPPDTTDPADIKFYLFFMIETEKAYATEYVTEREDYKQLTFVLILFITGLGCFLVLAVINYIVWRKSRVITSTIDVLTDLTNQLKKAQTLA